MAEVSAQDRITRRERLLLPLICAVWAVLAASHASMLPVPLFPLDDAYIAAHNATALRAGHDPNFPGVSALTGSTSLVHLLMVAAAESWMTQPWALWTCAWLSILLLMTGVARLARLSEMPWHLTAMLVSMSLLAADASYQILNGIETGLTMAIIIWAFALRLERSERRPWLQPMMLGLMPLVRPELSLLSALLWFERALHADPSQRVRRALRDAALAGAVLVPGMLVYLVATGSPLPQTLSVKRDFFASPCAGPAAQWQWFFRGAGVFCSRLNLSAVGLVLLCWPRVQWTGLAFGAGLLAACGLVFPYGVGHNEYRYLYPLLPLCLVGFAHAWLHARGWTRHVVLALAVCATLGALSGVPRSIMAYLGDLNLTEQELAPVAKFVREQLAPSDRVLVHDIGYISTAVPNVLIDVVGLKDPRAAELHRAWTATRCDAGTRAAVIAGLALERKARHLIVFANWDQTFQLTAGLRHLGWSLTALRPTSVIYQVYLLTPPRSGP